MSDLINYLTTLRENFDDIKDNDLMADVYREARHLKNLKKKVDYSLTSGLIEQSSQAKDEIKQEAKDAKNKTFLFWIFLAIILLVIVLIIIAIIRFFTKKVIPAIPDNMQMFQQQQQPQINSISSSPLMFSDYSSKPNIKGGSKYIKKL